MVAQLRDPPGRDGRCCCWGVRTATLAPCTRCHRTARSAHPSPRAGNTTGAARGLFGVVFASAPEINSNMQKQRSGEQFRVGDPPTPPRSPLGRPSRAPRLPGGQWEAEAVLWQSSPPSRAVGRVGWKGPLRSRSPNPRYGQGRLQAAHSPIQPGPQCQIAPNYGICDSLGSESLQGTDRAAQGRTAPAPLIPSQNGGGSPSGLPASKMADAR